jgi:hypothetical protein
MHRWVLCLTGTRTLVIIHSLRIGPGELTWANHYLPCALSQVFHPSIAIQSHVAVVKLTRPFPGGLVVIP